MDTIIWRSTGFMVCMLALLGCAGRALDPAAFPYLLVERHHEARQSIPADLDGDGRDELLEYGAFNLPNGGAVKIRTQHGETTEQINFSGQVQHPHVLDLNDDRFLELLVPFVRDDSLFVAIVDREQMQSVLENLVSNAVNTMPEGGRLTLSTHLVRDLPLPGSTEPRDFVVLEVLDTGTGMPETVRERLFEPGFSTSQNGTGLGLAIVRKIVTDDGGHIEVESEPGTGSAFSLFLPARCMSGRPK